MSKPVLLRAGQTEFLKLNTSGWQGRDAYQWLLGLRWPSFAAFVAVVYIMLNLLFATLYHVRSDCIAGMRAGSFSEAFFFSVQTLATVGYGHMYPQTLYGHIVTTVEVMSGVFLLAVMTGLIFVRFSRPNARIVFSKHVVIAPFNGRPTLMLRVGNLRQESMVEVEFRLMFTRDEPILEGDDFRHFYNLKLAFNRLAAWPAALTLRHTIDETSPLYGATIESLEGQRAILIASVVGIDPVISASVQKQQDYRSADFRFGHRFVEIYNQQADGKLAVDYGRLHETEPVQEAPPLKE